jgi:hypothetical protein
VKTRGSKNLASDYLAYFAQRERQDENPELLNIIQ